jgi:hypothetical protein
MKARVAIALFVLILAALVFIYVRYSGPESPPLPPPPAPSPAPPPVPDGAATTPEEAVVLYVDALYRKDFEEAYERLSSESREAHSYEEFLERAETGEATNYDLGAAEAGEEIDGRVIVTVPLVEDPASGGFTTVKEDGDWKVIFIGGEPWFPYPEEDVSQSEEE